MFTQTSHDYLWIMDASEENRSGFKAIFHRKQDHLLDNAPTLEKSIQLSSQP